MFFAAPLSLLKPPRLSGLTQFDRVVKLRQPLGVKLLEALQARYIY